MDQGFNAVKDLHNQDLGSLEYDNALAHHHFSQEGFKPFNLSKLLKWQVHG